MGKKIIDNPLPKVDTRRGKAKAPHTQQQAEKFAYTQLMPEARLKGRETQTLRLLQRAKTILKSIAVSLY